MKRYLLIFALFFIAIGMNACKKDEADLTPSNISDAYSLPQGNNAYDQTIVNYFQKYGTYILYKFTEKDAYWTPTVYKKPFASSVGFWSPGFEVEPSNEAFVPQQLALIQSKWFSFYSDKFLKTFLPTKILLCSKVDSISNTFVFGGPTVTYLKAVKKVGAAYSYDNIQVNYGDATINTMTATELRTFLAKINLTFIQSIIARGLSTPTAEFSSSADYITTITTYPLAYGKGIIMGPTNISAQADWNAYITAMVSYSTANLNTATANTNSSPVGILNAMKDNNGLIKKRYNMVRNYFLTEYNVDLQLIGDATKTP